MDLPEEQEKFLMTLDEEFSHRFTAEDKQYWEEHTSPLPAPPILEPWYNKPRRRFDYARRGRDSDQNGRGRHDRYRDRSFNRDLDQGRNHSSGRDQSFGRDSSHDRYDRFRNSRDQGYNRDRDQRGSRDRWDSNGGRGRQDRASNRDSRYHRDGDRYSGSPGRQQNR